MGIGYPGLGGNNERSICNCANSKTKKEKIEYQSYLVEVKQFNKEIPRYLETVRNKFTLKGTETIYNLEEESYIITNPCAHNSEKIEIRTFNCSRKVLNGLEKCIGGKK